MEQERNRSSRKKFVLWGLGILGSLTVLRFISPSKKKKETVKMLTQDGRLVEIEKDKLPATKRKITDQELKSWVRKK
jgi:hypothetical protein